MPIERLAAYAGETDWTLTGDYSGDYDDVTVDVDAEAGVTITRGRDQTSGRGRARTPASSSTLRNDHKRYSAEYAGSPLADNLLPGRPHRWSAVYGTDATMDDPSIRMEDLDTLMDGRATVRLFTGSLDELTQRPSLRERRVGVSALGSMLALKGRRITTALYETVTTGAAVVAAFQAAGLPSSLYDVDADMIANGRTMLYWYADDEDLYDVVTRLVLDTEGYPAAIYERGNGVIAVEGRNYRTLTTRSLISQATFWDRVTVTGEIAMDDPTVTMDDPEILMDGAGRGLYHTGFRYQPGIRDVINAASVSITTRTAQASGVVWTYGQTVTLDTSGEATVTAKPTDPFKTAIVPSIAGSDFALSAGVVTVALSQTSGGSTVISFTGGTSGATITGLRLRAVAMTPTSTVRVSNVLDTSASQTAYGVRSAQLDAYPGLGSTEAASLCDGIVLAYRDPRPLIDVDIVNTNGRQTYQIMQREVSDRIRVIDTQTGADLELIIEQISHKIGVGRTHTTTLFCEKVVETGWGLYDIGLFDDAIYGQ